MRQKPTASHADTRHGDLLPVGSYRDLDRLRRPVSLRQTPDDGRRPMAEHRTPSTGKQGCPQPRLPGGLPVAGEVDAAREHHPPAGRDLRADRPARDAERHRLGMRDDPALGLEHRPQLQVPTGAEGGRDGHEGTVPALRSTPPMHRPSCGHASQPGPCGRVAVSVSTPTAATCEIVAAVGAMNSHVAGGGRCQPICGSRDS